MAPIYFSFFINGAAHSLARMTIWRCPWCCSPHCRDCTDRTEMFQHHGQRLGHQDTIDFIPTTALGAPAQGLLYVLLCFIMAWRANAKLDILVLKT